MSGGASPDRQSWATQQGKATVGEATRTARASAARYMPGRGISSKQMLVMTSQLATMLAAGCDLCAGLETLARQQEHPRLRAIQQDLHDSVQAGQPFSQALAKYPDVFSTLYVTMVRAGESAGLLRSMLATLQAMVRNQIRITSSIRGALMYPCILICVAISAIVVMTTFVLPRFAAVFRSANAALPTPTIIVLGASEFISKHAVLIGLSVLMLIAAIIWLVRLPEVKKYTHAWILKVPLLGRAMQLSYVVRAIQTMGSLIKAGLPLADSLVLVRDMMPNLYYRSFFDELRQHIAEGKSLAPDFERSALFPPMVSQMMAVGEQTGSLPTVCLEIAAFHEEELQERIKLLTGALEPLIIIILGGFVGFIAISVILPMFKISSALH